MKASFHHIELEQKILLQYLCATEVLEKQRQQQELRPLNKEVLKFFIINSLHA